MRSLSAVCSELLEDNGLTLEDIDLFIPHQANLRIIEAVGDRLKLGSEKIFVNLDEYGNTSAASIPLASATPARRAASARGLASC